MDDIELKIYGETYRIRGALDPAYVEQLAARVDQRMRALADQTGTSDVRSLAVLAALNLADELQQAKQETPPEPEAEPASPSENLPRELAQRLAACNRQIEAALAESGDGSSKQSAKFA